MENIKNRIGELKDSRELQEIIRELNFYKKFVKMGQSVSVEMIENMVNEDIKVYEERKLCEENINSINNILSQVTHFSEEEVNGVICNLYNSRQNAQSVIKSREDMFAAKKVLDMMKNGNEETYSQLEKDVKEYKKSLKSGVSFNDLAEMVNTDLELFYSKCNVNFDDYFDTLPYDKYTNEEAENLTLGMFSELYNNQSVTQSRKDSFNKVLALAIVAKQQKND